MNNTFKELKTNSYGLKGDYATRKVANTRHLKRILYWLQEVDYANYTEIRNALNGCLTITDALKFLEGNNLIKSIQKNRGMGKIYFLPYKEELVKEKLRVESNLYSLKYKHLKNGNRLE